MLSGSGTGKEKEKEKEQSKSSHSQSGVTKSQVGGGGQKEQLGVNYPEIHPPIITFADIDPKYERYAYEKAEEAFKLMIKQEKKYYKDAAEFIKKAFDEEFGQSWHVIVGKNFGSFVTYEAKTMIYFWINSVGFMIFKFG